LLGSGPFEAELAAERELVPLLCERVQLCEQPRLERPPAPAAGQLTRELLRAAPVRQLHLLDPVLPPDLDRLLRVDRDEDARVPARRQVPEDAVVELVLRFRHEVQHVVRQPVVVTGRRPREEVGRPVTSDVHVVAAGVLCERDLH
jgi:hypothetical protein